MEKVKVAQWGGKHIIYLPLYLALYGNHFKAMGLDVELYPAGNDDQIYADVAAGQADFGIGDPTFVAIGAAHGDQCRVVAALLNKVAVWGVTHHPEIHEMKTIEDFVGLRFAVFPRPSTSFALIQCIKQNNEKRLRSMEVVETEPGNLMPLLASGKADVITEVEPMVSMAEIQGLRVVLSLGDFYPPLLFTGVSASTTTINENPEMVAKFVNGIQIGLTLCQGNAEKLIGVAKRLFPAVSDECLLNAIQRMQNERVWPEQALIQSSSWKNALEIRKNLGDLKSIEDPIKLLDQRFAYQAITGSM